MVPTRRAPGDFSKGEGKDTVLLAISILNIVFALLALGFQTITFKNYARVLDIWLICSGLLKHFDSQWSRNVTMSLGRPVSQI